MDAEHRRPFAAFLLVSAFAFAIMANGLREKVVEVIVDSGAPRPLISAVVPDILLGRSLSDAPEAPARTVGTEPASEAPAPVDRAVTEVVDTAAVDTTRADTASGRPGSGRTAPTGTTASRPRGGPDPAAKPTPTKPRDRAPTALADLPAPELPASPVDVPKVRDLPGRGQDAVDRNISNGRVRGLVDGNEDSRAGPGRHPATSLGADTSYDSVRDRGDSLRGDAIRGDRNGGDRVGGDRGHRDRGNRGDRGKRGGRSHHGNSGNHGNRGHGH